MNVRKHRRRLVCAVLSAVLVTLACWRFSQPNINPRLIGRWTIHHPEDKSWPRPMVELRPDGTATWWSANIPQNREYAPLPMRWSAKGNRLSWTFDDFPLLLRIQLEFDRLRARWCDPSGAAAHESLYQIVEITENQIAVDYIASDGSTDRFTFRREE